MDPHQQGPPQPDLLIGQTIGNYLVIQKLGEGGMGAVYLAEHPTIGKKVALKVLHSEFSTNQEVAARFFNEAKAVNDIGHPNIVDIVDFGIIQAGLGREQLVYFIMEYLSGLTLSQLIRQEAPLPPERALSIGLQVADALAASHKHGIIHRDLKPDNIMLQQRGRERDFIKLLDFGIAKLTGDAVGSHRTRTGIVMGTPAYMSPEQCEGRGNIDHRTDIYALGIVLYEMLTGRVPFIGEGYGEILVQHLTQRPIAPSQYRMLPPHVEAVVLKALEKRPELRYPNMDEMIRAMADPVGYVEANGGIGTFAQRQLMPSSAPLPSIKMTPAPLTPPPGTLQGLQGLSTPAPTTLGGATGEVHRRTSKVPFVVAGLLIVTGATIAIAVVASGKSVEPVATDPAGSNKLTTGSDTTKVVTPPVGSDKVTPPVGSDKVGVGSDEGSAVRTAPKITFVKIDSKPAGAEIYVDGIDSGHITPHTIEFPRNDKRVSFTIKLDKYEEHVFKDVVLDKDSTLELFDELKSVKPVIPNIPTTTGHTTTGHTTTGQTTGHTTTGHTTTGQTSTTGKGSGAKDNGKGSGHTSDTGLMNPDQ
ncbi:MAG TPA: serine/threonine-protein kinase [Kofleriaceae bacterium]|nr:serine/threonine-protein kinase [Kofleriaceae bacterium]